MKAVASYDKQYELLHLVNMRLLNVFDTITFICNTYICFSVYLKVIIYNFLIIYNIVLLIIALQLYMDCHYLIILLSGDVISNNQASIFINMFYLFINIKGYNICCKNICNMYASV